jgi:hypothetical protein
MFRYLSVLFLAFVFFSCTNSEIGNSKDVSPESIYCHYRVWGDEDNGIVTVKLQFRFGGPNGTSLLLDDPSKAELDGVELRADSSQFQGAYYEMIKPVDEFAGKHTIVFTDLNEKKYKEEFDYPIVSFVTQLPDTVRRNDIVLDITGLKSNDQVRLLLNDTSFYGRGIEKIDTIKNGRIKISKIELENLKNGPIHLELFREVERELADATKEGGSISISYGLKREFILED